MKIICRNKTKNYLKRSPDTEKKKDDKDNACEL